MLAVMFLTVQSYAQEVASAVSNEDFLKLLIESIGGAKGASTLGILFLVVKLVLAFFDTPLYEQLFGSKLKGPMKLTIVLGLSFLSSLLTQVYLNNLSWGAAIIHSGTFSMLVAFSNQIYKQYIEKKV